MKKLCMLVALTVAIFLTGCNKGGGADVRELLQNVPNTASFVAAVDVESLLEKTGSKIDGDKVKPSPELLVAIDSSKDGSFKQVAHALLDGECGVAPSALVLFADGYKVYCTGLLADTSAFEEYVKKYNGGAWQESDGVKTNGKMAVSGNRFWYLAQGAGEIDSADIRQYMALSEKQSFASGDFASLVSGSDKDVAGWCDLNGVLNVANLDFQSRALFKMGLSALFEDAGFSVFDIDFQKGKALMSGRLINGKGDDAKYLFPADKVNVGAFDNINVKCDGVVAASVPHKLIEQLRNQTKGQLSMLGVVLQALGSVNGTVAVAMGNDRNAGFKGVVETTGSGDSDLMGLLRELGFETAKEGKNVMFSKGEVTGGSDAKKLAESLKGCTMGMSASAEFTGGKSNIRQTVVKLTPRSGSMVLEMEAVTSESDVNALVSLLKAAK